MFIIYKEILFYLIMSIFSNNLKKKEWERNGYYFLLFKLECFILGCLK